MKLHLKNWQDNFLSELSNTKSLRIISPFIQEQILRKMQKKFDFNNFELITRFNLQDFHSKVSSLSGLEFCIQNGSKVYGIKGLHSKIYLFDDRAAIISSANLTDGGLLNNYECGIFITDPSVIKDLNSHFSELKKIAGNPVDSITCDSWKEELSQIKFENFYKPNLPDYGATLSPPVEKKRNYYVKFFGSAKSRVPDSYLTREEIEEALCHYACGFSEKKKPRQINDGDIIYMACMTKNPSDYAIFGRAEAIKFVEGRDKATATEINQREWKKDWPIYLRVKNAKFIEGTMTDCVRLSRLINDMEHESFASTSQRYKDGEREINPLKSLNQQAYVKLTPIAAEWLHSKFDEAIKTNGEVDDKFIKNLPKSETAGF